jgi:hypothetical protein
MIEPTSTAVSDEKRKLDAELDQALAQTFPASDPFSVGHFTATEPPTRPVNTKPPLMSGEKRAGRARHRRGRVRRTGPDPGVGPEA